MTCVVVIITLWLLLQVPNCLSKSCSCRTRTNTADNLQKLCQCNAPNLTHFLPEIDGVTELTLKDVSGEIKRETFQPYRATLQELHIKGGSKNFSIAENAFSDLKKLHTIEIHHVKMLTLIQKKTLQLKLHGFRGLNIYGCGLQEIPFLDDLAVNAGYLHEYIHLDQNEIRAVPSNAMRVLAHEIHLENNLIEFIDEAAFNGSSIGALSLKGNHRLVRIHERAFAGLLALTTLDLSETSIVMLPTADLSGLLLKTLRLQQTHSLKIFPSVYDLQELTEAQLTYAYHCCAFKHPDIHSPTVHADKIRHHLCLDQCEEDQTQIPAGIFYSKTKRSPVEQSHGNFGKSVPKISSPDTSLASANVTRTICCGKMTPLASRFQDLICHPEPDAFNPCEDIMGNTGLRVAVWFVVVAAVVGNVAVMVVLMSSRFKMTVSKYLMCNLAFADFCMGIYLLIVASEDANTVGEYFNHAIGWQEGLGCQVAGFLTVFASELSIFTLTVITLERWYAITYAIHLNKRLKLGMAAKVIVFGWVYAATLASLPLLGISNYTMTSICLPFGTQDVASVAYLISLLSINGLAFLLICACYTKMYLSISGHNSTVTQSDKTVAKRMALLVFTDFACWAPIAFFGLTAVGGYPLIDVTKSKILLVFFYPLNSCANPFLYAIFTKQYRKDLYLLLGQYGLCIRRANHYLRPGSNANTATRNATNSTSALSESSLRNSMKIYYFSNGKKRGSDASSVTRNPSENGNLRSPAATCHFQSAESSSAERNGFQKEATLSFGGGISDGDRGKILHCVVEECSEVFTSEEDLAQNLSPMRPERSPKLIKYDQNAPIGAKLMPGSLRRHLSFETCVQDCLNAEKPYEDCHIALLQENGMK